MATPSGATPKPFLIRDPVTGGIILPGRCVRSYVDPMLKGGGIDTAAWQIIAGTQTQPVDMTTTRFMARTTVATAASNGSAAAVRAATAAAFAKITPDNVEALELTLEGLSSDADSGYDFEMGFNGSTTNTGGAYYRHANGSTTAVIRSYDASTSVTDTATNHQFEYANGGGSKRRNLTFLLLPHGYAGQTGASSSFVPMAFVLEDDQVQVAVTLPNLSLSSSVWPQFAVTTRTASARNLIWAQTKLRIAHN
jgi:hypothetical protein